jgi:hypothetical protein
MPVSARAIIPRPFNARLIRQQLERGMEEYNELVKQDFEATVETWEHEVEFHAEVKDTPQGLVAEVSTEDEIYGYVNNGTDPHPIRAKNAKALAFPGGGYVAKTIPGMVGSQSGGPAGDTAFAKEVQHPGTEARKFDEAIKKKRRGDFARIMLRALLRGARATGYAR